MVNFDVEAIHALTGVDKDTILGAKENLEKRYVCFLVVSGRMGAGKDTVAPLAIKAAGFTAVHCSFADKLKNDINDMLVKVRQIQTKRCPSLYATETCLIYKWEIEPRYAKKMAVLLTELAQDPSMHSRMRTPTMRKLLQYYGSEVRRSSDPDYWVRQALRGVLKDLANGKSVYVTDARFVNEVKWPQAAGAFVVRLGISPEVQKARLTDRDGQEPKLAALTHMSETQLDSYNGFDLLLNTDNLGVDEVVSSIVTAIK